MKRTAVCSVLFFAMFMVLAGILCMGVAAEDTYTLVNPANSTNYETVGVETGAEVVWVPFTDSSTTDTLSWYERKCATLSELPEICQAIPMVCFSSLSQAKTHSAVL